MNGATVSPRCWHRVSQGWWTLSPSPPPPWRGAAARGVAGGPCSRPRGSGRRRRCGSPREVIPAAFPFPGAHKWGRGGVAVPSHAWVLSFPTGTGQKGEKGEKGERGLKGDSGTGGIVGPGSVKGQKVGERWSLGLEGASDTSVFDTCSCLFLILRGRRETWASR